MDKVLFLVLLVMKVSGEDPLSKPLDGQGTSRSSGHYSQKSPSCPAGETCTIDQNCKAPDGTSYCVKDIWIKQCPVGQSLCTLYDGSTGCSTCCDGIPECIDLSDEGPCNKYKCKANWRLEYEHDANGNTISGSKSALRDAVRRGAEVRILVKDSYIDTPETTLLVRDNVCGQHIFHVSKASWSSFQSNVYWWFTELCTTGDRSMSRWNVGSHSSRSDNQDTTGMKWFIRETPDQPILTIPASGRSLNALINAVKTSGYGVTVQHTLDQRHEEYHPADNLEMSPDGKTIVSQTVWSLVNEVHKTVVKPSKSGNWFFKHFASDGALEFSKYLVGENSRVAVDTAYPSESVWHFDPCWELIYANRANGSGAYGTMQNLINAVLAGNRVKVMINDTISQTSVVYLNGGVVTALLPNLLKKSNISTLEETATAGAKWEMKLVNTYGKVETATYLVGDTSGAIVSSFADIKWFVDKRQWQKVLDVGPNGIVNNGSKTQLAKEIRNGADVRFAWVSANAIHTVMEADNIGFDGSTENFGAMHIRSLLLKSFGNEYKFETSSNIPIWLFTITSNSGTVKTSKWALGKHVSMGDYTSSERVIWWIAN